jgi:hypothetical protein
MFVKLFVGSVPRTISEEEVQNTTLQFCNSDINSSLGKHVKMM